MKAILYESFRAPPRYVSVADPSPSPGGVVIKVEATGLCMSDWHGWMGHDPDIRLPHVPGHELAGVVVAVGKDVRKWHGGERVTLPFVCGCGLCPQCIDGNPQVCDHQFQPGFTAWGSFAELVAVDFADGNLVQLPDDVEFETAAVLGCRFVTSFRALTAQGRLQAGQRLAVHGCGGVGLSAVMIAKALDARVIAVDISQAALKLAEDLGADFCIQANQLLDVVASIKNLSKGGAHVSLDALGSLSTCHNSIACLRKRGRHVQVGLLADNDGVVEVPMGRIIAEELEIVGSHGMAASQYPEVFSLMADKRIEPRHLIGRRINLAEAGDALGKATAGGQAGVTIIRPGT